MEWNPERYLDVKCRLARQPDFIIDLEKRTAEQLLAVLLQKAPAIKEDFNHASEVASHWIHYAPEQRGRAPSGAGVPWLEVAEYATGSHLVIGLATTVDAIRFPGLPLGGDVRFADEQRFVHVDMKATGPNDLDDEVVVPPYQVSGDGAATDSDGVKNSHLLVTGRRRTSEFAPALPPFYLYEDGPKLCLTFFLKVNYDVTGYGNQPFRDMELVCLPNGLLLFEGPEYYKTPGLFTPGKDDQSKPLSKRRMRVKFAGLAAIDNWRAMKLYEQGGDWQATPRT